LFGQQTNNGTRTELLVVITPQVVRTSDEVREVSADLRSRMQSLPMPEAAVVPPSRPVTP